MANVSEWANTAAGAGNNVAAPDGSPEGMTAGSVNNSIREIMAALRRYLEDDLWFNYGDTITFSSFSSPTFTFTVTGDATARYHVGRPLRVVGSSTGTLYGTIASSSFSSVTTVAVTMNSGTVVNETLEVSLGVAAINSPVAATSTPAVNEVEIGTVVMYAGTAVPDATWAFCDGSSLDSVADTTLATLFGRISNTYGGSGASDFNLPDLRGRVSAGRDNMGGTGASRLTSSGKAAINGTVVGASGGAQDHTLVEAEIPAHTHSVGNQSTASHDGSGNVSATPGSGTTGSTGGGGAHNNVQPTIVMNFIIKIKATT